MEARRVPVSWPTGGWESATAEAQGMHPGILMHLHTFIQEQSLPIYAMLIIRRGRLVFEHYYREKVAHHTQALRSATKSVTSALVGMALCRASLAALDQTLPELLPDERLFALDEQKRAITLRQLLTMTSGLDNLLSGRYHFDGYSSFVEAVFATPLFAPPGQTFRYAAPSAEVLAHLLEQTVNRDLLSFATEHLFRPLGISTDAQSGFLWEKKPDGRYRGGDGLHLTPRDMAKIGYLYLYEGYWEDQPLVPRVYVQSSTQRQSMGGWPEESSYGFLWWITTLGEHAAFFAAGIGGQFIFVVPALELVVVICSEDMRRSGAPQKALLAQFVLPAILDDKEKHL